MILSATLQFLMVRLDKFALASPSRTDVVVLNGLVRRAPVKDWGFSSCGIFILEALNNSNYIINVSGLRTSKGPKAHS